jgi:hypothetical protein
VNTWDLIPALLLMLLSLSLVSGAVILFVIVHLRGKQFEAVKAADQIQHLDPSAPPGTHQFSQRPHIWLAIRSKHLEHVQAALGLSNPRPCSWTQGLTSEQKLFIAPPVHGWILVTGWGLPDPADDVDVCFRFLLDLSRKLGQVHYFNANPVVRHHAWVRAENGRIARAYAWAGQTLWNQGVKTQSEIDLELKCFHYFESPEPSLFGQPDLIPSNVDKVPALAAQWSIDPAAIDEQILDHVCGIAGESRRIY